MISLTPSLRTRLNPIPRRTVGTTRTASRVKHPITYDRAQIAPVREATRW